VTNSEREYVVLVLVVYITLLMRYGNESLYEKVSGEISRICMHGIQKERGRGRERKQMRKRTAMLSVESTEL